MELSFATAAVKIVLGKIADLAVDKVFELCGVRDEVKRMRVELTVIVGFLEDVSSKPINDSHAVENWLIELKDVAKSIDGVIETYRNEIPKGKYKGIFRKPLKLNHISDGIRQNARVLNTLYERGTQLGIIEKVTKDPAPLPLSSPVNNYNTQIINHNTQIFNTLYEPGAEVGTTSSATATEDPTPLPLTAPNKHSNIDVEDPEVVGLEHDRKKIVTQLLDQSISRRSVLSIVGIGGLGKTTLAQKIYNSAELDGEFDCCAWLFISQTFNKNNIFREILYSIKPEILEEKNPPLEDKYLVTEVKNCLMDKRYLIILDDVWDTDVWKELINALPDANNASRVIITTRSLNVARAADHNTDPYELRVLRDDDSVTLLLRTALQRVDNYPSGLKNVAQNLIKKCGGLPLALVVLGGILSEEEDTVGAWDLVYRTMNWHDEDVEGKCMKILAMSYEALPKNHLKQCFLYFASFSKDYEISAQQMTKMWVADELTPDGAGSLEDRAEKCLRELVKRCLVQVTKKSKNGSCKTCRMHDLVRELAIHKAHEDNFFTVLRKKGDGGNRQLRPVRLAVQYGSSIDDDVMDSTNIRSLLCFGVNMSNFKYQGFKELRVLLFEHVDFKSVHTTSFKNWLENLVHLRYLGFRNCKVFDGVLSGNISNMNSLQTLDATMTSLSVSPSLWEIRTLRHVINCRVNFPSNWDYLQNLQTLKGVHPKGSPTIEYNINNNTLKIGYPIEKKRDSRPKILPSGFQIIETVIPSAEERWKTFRALLSGITHLVSLAITVDDLRCKVPFFSEGTQNLPCHEKIQSLFLGGAWDTQVRASLRVEMFPKNLVKLKLEHSWLTEDSMPILGSLQSLQILYLLFNSYGGTEMRCSSGNFPSLQKLKLNALNELKQWEIEQGAMPVLNHLEIIYCRNLHTLPELQNLASLQELIVTGASTQLHQRSQIEDRCKIEHIPSVHITMESE